jgi:hypothetical protein
MTATGRSFIYVAALKELRQKIMRDVERMRITADPAGIGLSIFRNHIRPIIEHYKPIVSPLASHYGDGFYRARKCNGSVPYCDINELLNPPIPTGRAMVTDGQPILYASSSMQTCLAEIEPKIGDYVNLVGLNYSEIMTQPFWFVGQLASFNKSQEPSHYVGELLDLHRPAYFPAEAQQSFIYQDALINEIFSEFSSPIDGYALNQLLIQEINEKVAATERLAGVVYLSTKDAPGINFAIFGDAIKELKIGQLNYFEITDIDDYGNVAWKLLKNGNNQDGVISWKDL